MLQRFLLGDPSKVHVGRKELQLVSYAELRENRVDRADLHSAPASAIADLRGLVVVVTIWGDERKSGEASDDRLLRARSVEALKDLLIDEAGRNNEIAACQRSLEGSDLRHGGRCVAPKREGPNARVDEQAQSRDRSCL